MKNKKILLLVFILLIGITLSGAIFAAEEQTWGPHWYTPYTATVSANSDSVKGSSMKWTSEQISLFDSNDYWELEFRPKNSSGSLINPNTIWVGKGSISSNLPSAYREFDENDVTVATKKCNALQAEKSYYATQTLTEVSNPASATFIIESEMGSYFLIDGFPEYYEVFMTNAVKNTSYSW